MMFGEKVKFAEPHNVHIDLRDKEFCLIGSDESAFALIEWDKRGEYGFEFYSGDPEKLLVVVPNV